MWLAVAKGALSPIPAVAVTRVLGRLTDVTSVGVWTADTTRRKQEVTSRDNAERTQQEVMSKANTKIR